MTRLGAWMSCVVLLCVGCHRNDDPGQAPPAPPGPEATAAAAGSARPGLCASGGGKLDDAVSAPMLPRQVGGYCVDPNAPVRAYGRLAKGTLEQVCTDLFDGECVTYQNYALERVVSLRYVDGGGSLGTVAVNLSRFESTNLAFGFFTKRVVADMDPVQLTTKPLAAGAMGALGTGIAYVWRGQYVAELSYTNEQESPKELAASSQKVLPPLAQAIGELVVGDKALPPAARLLPEADRIALGIEFEPRDGLGISGVGPAVFGHYRASQARFSVMVLQRANDAAAVDVMKTLKKQTTVKESRGKTSGVLSLAARSSEEGPKTEWVIGRSGRVVIGVGDDERAQGGASALSAEAKRERLDSILGSLPPTEGSQP
jgi:hypothetical protein